jgi:hypothetical protein
MMTMMMKKRKHMNQGQRSTMTTTTTMLTPKETNRMTMTKRIQHRPLQRQLSLDEVALWVIVIGHLKKNNVFIIILFSSNISRMMTNRLIHRSMSVLFRNEHIRPHHHRLRHRRAHSSKRIQSIKNNNL